MGKETSTLARGTAMNRNIRKSVIAGLGITCVAVGIGLVSLSPASAVEAAPTSTLQSHGTGARAAQPNIQTMINANQSDHDLDMTITSADGGVVHAVVKPHQGWYPEIDVTGKDTILVKDAAGVAFVGEFTHNGDWVAGHMERTSRLAYTWHTGPYGGFDFR